MTHVSLHRRHVKAGNETSRCWFGPSVGCAKCCLGLGVNAEHGRPARNGKRTGNGGGARERTKEKYGRKVMNDRAISWDDRLPNTRTKSDNLPKCVPGVIVCLASCRIGRARGSCGFRPRGPGDEKKKENTCPRVVTKSLPMFGDYR